MRLEITNSERRLTELEAAWWSLWRSARRTTPFSSPAWQIPWFSCLAQQSELRLVAVHSSAGLEALLPLFTFCWEGERRAALLGAGISDYLDVILGGAPSLEVLELLRTGLEEVAADVDRLELADVPAGSPLCELSRGIAGASLERHAVCPVVVLERELSLYFGGLPRSLRRSLARGRRGLSRFRFASWQRADDATLEPLLEGLFALHAARWRERGEPGVLADLRVQCFHREAAPRLLRAGLLRLHVLDIDGAPAGAVYVLHGRDAYLYLSGYRPEFRADGIGHLLIERALSDAHASGKRRCDFLRGTESYKYDWGARDELTHRIRLKGGAP